MSNVTRETAIDRLYDLQHDLAKYIRMPLAFLPSHATPDEVRVALQRALRTTYRRAEDVLPASMLWQQCADSLPDAVRAHASFERLERVIERALAWDAAIDDVRVTIDRNRVLGDFGAITAAIDLLIADVELETGSS
ncbi:MAG: hypothetical protein AAFP04_00005 [Myxococcota bacterium]